MAAASTMRPRLQVVEVIVRSSTDLRSRGPPPAARAFVAPTEGTQSQRQRGDRAINRIATSMFMGFLR